MSSYTSKQTTIEAYPPSEQVPLRVSAILNQSFRLMDAGFYFRLLGVLLLIAVISSVMNIFLPHGSEMLNRISFLISLLIRIPLSFAMYDYLMQRAERKEPIRFFETLLDIINRVGRIYYMVLLMTLSSLVIIIPSALVVYLLAGATKLSGTGVTLSIVFSAGLFIFLLSLLFIFFVAPMVPLALRTNVGIQIYSECIAMMKKHFNFTGILAVTAPILFLCLVMGLVFLLAKAIGLVPAALMGGLAVIGLNPFLSMYVAILWTRLLADRPIK